MNRLLCLCLLIAGAFTVMFASSKPHDKSATDEVRAHKSSATIEGLVRDVACPIQNLDATATHLNMKCLRECARGGSPIVILTKAGQLFLPISDSMPDVDQRQKLMPFLGKFVRVKGTVFERNGTRAIVISEITEMKGVHLKIDEE